MEKLIFKNTIDDFVDAYLLVSKKNILANLSTYIFPRIGYPIICFVVILLLANKSLFNVCTFYTIIMINRLTLMILSSQIVYIETDKYSTIQIINGNDWCYWLIKEFYSPVRKILWRKLIWTYIPIFDYICDLLLYVIITLSFYLLGGDFFECLRYLQFYFDLLLAKKLKVSYALFGA